MDSVDDDIITGSNLDTSNTLDRIDDNDASENGIDDTVT